VVSALTTWLDLRRTDRATPAPLERKLHPFVGFQQMTHALFSIPSPMPEGWQLHPTRALANAFVLHAVREMEIEQNHAGQTVSLPIDQHRLRRSETHGIVTEAASHFYGMFHVLEYTQQVVGARLLSREALVGALLANSHSPLEWSLADEIRVVTLNGRAPQPQDRPWAAPLKPNPRGSG
jgi:hypothetical protein